MTADEEQESGELMAAAESSIGFWDNPVDDEIWDRAWTGIGTSLKVRRGVE